MKFATKLICHRPPHLRRVATIHGEILILSAYMEENASIYCILIASNFVIRPQISIRAYFRCLQITFFMSLFFWLFTFAINLWHRIFVTADVTAVCVNNQHGIQRQGQDFNKKFVFESVHNKEVDRRIS